ncbi:MAG TPA: hypothetical protein VL588_06765 [Bdellovibrionota bacterium]|nr:hypothetical protein [Bdellovibrionota bacterium]
MKTVQIRYGWLSLVLALTAGTGWSYSTLAGELGLDLRLLPIYSKTNNSVLSDGGTFTAPAVNPESGFGYDVRSTLSYTLWHHLALGVSANLYGTSQKRDAVAGGVESLDQSTSRFEWGPSIGYTSGGFHLVFTALLSGNKVIKDKRVDSTGAVTYDTRTEKTLGFGYQIAVEYGVHLSNKLRLGPALIYREVNYKSMTLVDNVTPANNRTNSPYLTKAVEGGLTPMCVLMFDF